MSYHSSLTVLVFALAINSIPPMLHGMPRNPDSWGHLIAISSIASSSEAFKVSIDSPYPLFYFITWSIGIETPFKASIFSSITTSMIALMTFLLAKEVTKDYKLSVFAGLLTASSNVFILAENTFIPEPLGVFFFLMLAILIVKGKSILATMAFPLLLFSHPLITYFFLLSFFIYALEQFRKEGRKLILIWLACLSMTIPSFYYCGVLKYGLTYLPPWVKFLPFQINTASSFPLFVLALATALIITLHKASGKVKILIGISVIFALMVCFSLIRIPYTEFQLFPALLLFYTPIIVLIILGLMNLEHTHDFIMSWILALGISMLFSLSILGLAIPIYRHLGILIPAIAIPASLTYKRQFGPYLMICLVLSLVLTAYPSPAYTFGYDVQYYPQEYEALKWLAAQEPKPILTDVRMRGMAEYATGFPLPWRGVPDPNKAPPMDCYVVITKSMIEYGAQYEWWRMPVKVDLNSFLKSPYYRLVYENSHVWIFTIRC